jgi:beta-lactamase class C
MAAPEYLPAAVPAAVLDAIASGSTDGLIVAVARGHARPRIEAFGVDGMGQPLSPDSLLAVASITKLATALAILRLVTNGRVDLDVPLTTYLPDALAAQDQRVTARAVLCHAAGLPFEGPSELAPYRAGTDWSVVAQACLLTPLAREPWQRISYSNVGAGLLAIVVERVTGAPFATALQRLVLEPLNVEASLGPTTTRSPARVGGRLGDHAGSDLEPFNSRFWRGLALPWGGLVTTVGGALALVRAFSGLPSHFLPEALRLEATSDQTRGLPGDMMGLIEGQHFAWGLGPDLRGDKLPYWAAAASPTAFGHCGSTGCLAYVDPVRDVAWAIHGARAMGGLFTFLPSITAAILNRATG